MFKQLNDVQEFLHLLTKEQVICCFQTLTEFKQYLSEKKNYMKHLRKPGETEYKATGHLGLQSDGSLVFNETVYA
jgi:hypothetical protein